MCSFSCPVAHESARETLTPWGKMSLAAATVPEAPRGPPLPRKLEVLAEKALRLVSTEERRPLDAEGAEAFYGCTGCLRCRSFCDHRNDVPHALYEARAHAASRNLAPAAARAVADRFARSRHAQGDELPAALTRLADSHPSPPGATSVVFAGCEAPISSPQSVSSFVKAASALKVSLGVASDPLCCGRPLFEAGWRDAFRAHVSDAWARLGDREVVTPSAACARALTEYAREVGVEPRGAVVHATTFLARRLGPEVQGRPLDLSVAYHDPCHLVRGLGEEEAPRRLLRAALATPLKEAASHGAESDCCGAGGLVPRTYPDLARAMAMTRADELREAGAQTVATACPACRGALEGAGLRVVDVSELVARWLGVE